MSALNKGRSGQRAGCVLDRACAEVLEPRMMLSGDLGEEQPQPPVYGPIQIDPEPVVPPYDGIIIMPPPWPEWSPYPIRLIGLPEFDITIPRLLPQPAGWYGYGPAPAGLWPTRSIPLESLVPGSEGSVKDEESPSLSLFSQDEIKPRRMGISVLWDE